MGRTPLQRLQDAFRRRFGSEILRTSSSNVEAAASCRTFQRQEEAAALVLLQDDALVQRRAGKAPMTAQQQAQDPGRFYNTGADTNEATRNRASPDVRYNRPSNLNPRRAEENQADIRRMKQQRTETTVNTPWGLWTAASGPAKGIIVSQASITAIMEESRRAQLDIDIRQRDHTDFGKKAWIQSDKSSSAWVTTCPKGHNRLTDR
jgi:hypothetical protein